MPLRDFKYIIALTAKTAILSEYFGLTIFYFKTLNHIPHNFDSFTQCISQKLIIC